MELKTSTDLLSLTPRGLKRGDLFSPLTMKPLSKHLIHRLELNRRNLMRKKEAKSLRQAFLEALDETMESEPQTSLEHLPKKRYSSLDTYANLNRAHQVLKYMGNCKDPYYLIRHSRMLDLSR